MSGTANNTISGSYIGANASGDTSEFSAAVSAETCLEFYTPLAMRQY